MSDGLSKRKLDLPAEGEARVRRMSTRTLRANLLAITRAHVDWSGLASGRFEKKPQCPMCCATMSCGTCALHAFAGVGYHYDECSKAYHAWDDARDRACDKMLKHPLKTKDCRYYADLMRGILWKIKLVIKSELRKRGAK